MADQLLKNTCFHEIDVAGIPKNSDITRVVSVIDDKATMHTRQADAGDASSTKAFEPELQKPDGTRLFLITSYHEDKKVIDAATVTQAKKDERENIKLGDAAGDGTQEHAARAAADKVYEARKLKVDEAARSAGMTDVDLAEAKKFLDTNDLFTLLIDQGKSKEDIFDAAKAAEMAGGKRTRRRKNHGSKRRNASNKSGRRASKQSRRRGKKQSKRHGRK